MVTCWATFIARFGAPAFRSQLEVNPNPNPNPNPDPDPGPNPDPDSTPDPDPSPTPNPGPDSVTLALARHAQARRVAPLERGAAGGVAAAHVAGRGGGARQPCRVREEGATVLYS